MSERSPALLVWMVYRGGWGFIGTLSWTCTAFYFIREVGMSPLQLVLAGTALELAYFLFEIPTAIVADLYSRRLSVIVAAVVSGVGMIGIGLLPFVGWVIAGMALWGFGWTFRSGAEDAWLADEVGSDRVGVAYQRGAQVARVTGLLGIAVAVGLALVDLRLPLVGAGCTSILLAAYLAFRMPEGGFTRMDRQQLSTVGAMLSTARDGRRVVRSSPILVLIVVIFVLLGAFQEGFDRLWEAHLLLDVGLPGIGDLSPVVWFGLLGAATLVLAFAVAAPAVRRVELLRAERLARLLLVLHAALMVCALTFALAGSLWLAIPAYLATAALRDLAGPPSEHLAQPGGHRLLGARHRALDRQHRRQLRGVDRGTGAGPDRQHLGRAHRPGRWSTPAGSDAGALHPGHPPPRDAGGVPRRNHRDASLLHDAGMSSEQQHGVVFPQAPDGRRSTSALGRSVLADALRAADPAGARAAEQETNWRSDYLAHFRSAVVAGLDSRAAALSIATDGLPRSTTGCGSPGPTATSPSATGPRPRSWRPPRCAGRGSRRPSSRCPTTAPGCAATPCAHSSTAGSVTAWSSRRRPTRSAR